MNLSEMIITSNKKVNVLKLWHAYEIKKQNKTKQEQNSDINKCKNNVKNKEKKNAKTKDFVKNT